MDTTRIQTVRSLHAEAATLRSWADANLPEGRRLELYRLAARLEQTARALADEPLLRRVGGDVSESTRLMWGQARHGLKRRVG